MKKQLIIKSKKMKTKLLKTTIGVMLGAFLSTGVNATTFTATTSGNWSSSTTWGGISVGAILSTDDVVIPNGITVTADMDLSISGAIHTFTVNGTLQGSNSSTMLVIDNSTLNGSGTIDMGSIHFRGLLASSSFSGSATVHTFTNEASTLILSGMTTVKDTLNLEGGSTSLSGSSSLTMNAASNIRVNNGTFALNGGTMNGSSYNVWYVGSSKNSGAELSGSGLNDVTLNLSSATASVMAKSNTTVNGDLNMMKGKIDLDSRTWMVNGTFHQWSNASFIGNASAELHLNLTSSSNDTLRFDDANQYLHKLKVNLSDNGTVVLVSNLMVNNDLMLSKGKLNVMDHTLSIQSGGMISAYSDNNYVVTSGSGKLSMNVITNDSYVVFPVGTSSSYSPASIQQTASGSTGMFMVSTMDGLWAQGSTGTNIATTQKVVNRTWMVEGDLGVNVNMNLKLGWVAAAEANGFNRTHMFITHYHDAMWDTYASSAAISASNNTYEATRLNITSLSPFGVADQNSSVEVNETAGLSINVFPNPSADFLIVGGTSADAYKYEVSDLSGKSVLTSSMNKIDVSNLKTGFYFIKATNLNSNECVVKSFVKE
jgi:hypothetical protein